MKGRPSKYNDSFIDPTRYLLGCGRENMKLPTIEGYALFLGVHRDTLYEWAKHHKDFSDTLRDIEQIQKEQLINDGIYGGKEVNATIVKLLLQNNHGMREKTELTGENGEPIKLNIISGADYVSTLGNIATTSTGSTIQGSATV